MSQDIQFTTEQIAAFKALLASIPASTPAPAQPKPNPKTTILGLSWKTSASGVAGAVSTVLLLFAGYVVFASGPPWHVAFPNWVQAAAGFIGTLGLTGLGGSLASLGFSAKDNNVTGGSIVQPGIAVANPDTVARLAEHAALPAAAPVVVEKVLA